TPARLWPTPRRCRTPTPPRSATTAPRRPWPTTTITPSTITRRRTTPRRPTSRPPSPPTRRRTWPMRTLPSTAWKGRRPPRRTRACWPSKSFWSRCPWRTTTARRWSNEPAQHWLPVPRGPEKPLEKPHHEYRLHWRAYRLPADDRRGGASHLEYLRHHAVGGGQQRHHRVLELRRACPDGCAHRRGNPPD